MELFERNKFHFHHRSGVKLQSQRLNMSIILPVKHCGGSETRDLDHPFLLETQSSNDHLHLSLDNHSKHISTLGEWFESDSAGGG